MTKPDPLEWLLGKPPYPGWWNASNSGDEDAWRWWDGCCWSGVAWPEMDAKQAAYNAVHPAAFPNIKWRWYYPANARVPRIDPRPQPRAEARACRRCGAHMHPGKALVTLATGVADFGDGDVATMSPDPSKPKLIDCLKCEQCGWSVTV